MSDKQKSKPIFPLIVLALLVAAGAYLYLNFGNIAKNVTQDIASNALGVKVRIASLDISLQNKEVIVNGLKIANPPGYKDPYAITVETITIGLNSASKELIDFKNIRVDGSVINLEVTEKGNNLSDLKKLAAAKPQKEAAGSEQIRVIVQNVVIGASTLNPRVTLLGNEMGSVKIPSVSLSGIGQRENGILARDAIKQVITKYTSVAEGKAQTAGLFSAAEGVVEAVVDVGEGTLGAVEDVGAEIEDIGKSIGGLFLE